VKVPSQRRPESHLATVVVPAWALSLLVHLLFLAAVVLLAGGGTRSGQSSEEVERELVVQLTTEPVPETVPQGADQKAAAQSPAASSAEIQRKLDEVFQPQAKPLDVLPPSLDPLGAAARDLEWLPNAPPKLPPSAGLAETQFFGAGGKGTKFVYVIDRSASMQQVLPVAREELLKSLAALPATAQFQIVYYHLEAHTLDGPIGLLPATQMNKDRAAALLQGLKSEGGTDHIRALKRALALSPQVLYFLTDADELKPQQVQELTALNQRTGQAQIHCIELSMANAQKSDTPMRLLARNNRGQYRSFDLLRELRRREMEKFPR
jgi:hypothetical protein